MALRITAQGAISNDPNDYVKIVSNGEITSRKYGSRSGRTMEFTSCVHNDNSVLDKPVVYIKSIDAGRGSNHTALTLEVGSNEYGGSNGNNDIALNIKNGNIKVKNKIGYTGDVLIREGNYIKPSTYLEIINVIIVGTKQK